MPAFTNGPGVYVSETLNTSFTPAFNSGTGAVFFGLAERGPETPALLNDWVSYKRLYGELDDDIDLGYSVYHYFVNGGRAAYVVRVLSASAVKANVSLSYTPTGNGASGGASPFFTATAVSPGVWGNDVSVQVLDGLTDSTFTLIVRNAGVEVERWPELSLDPNSNRNAATIVNNYSSNLRLSALATIVEGQFASGPSSLTTGSDGAAITSSDWSAAFDKIDNIEGDLILNAVGLVASTDGSILNVLANKARVRGDSMVIVDPDKGLTSVTDITTNAATFVGTLTDANKGYTAHYAPCLRMVDPSKSGPGAVRVTYPGGAIAGIMSRFEAQKTVAAAPAGYSADIIGALGLELPLSSANLGTLYESTTAPINSFKAVPGAGVVVFGARTMNVLKPDKFIPVRRTLNYLKYQLKARTEFAVFEPNDSNLWVRINASLSGFLTDFYQSGGLKGSSASEAYYIVCDQTNNTTSTIDQGYVNIEVGVCLLYPAEYIQINISQWTGGSNSIENL